MIDPVLNFAKCTVSIGYNDTDTSIALTAGHGAKLPAPATSGAFNLVWWNSTDYPDPSDDPNVEIVRVTARSTDTLTVTRAQEGTAASTKNTGGKTYKMILAMTAKMITDIGTAGSLISVEVFTADGTWTKPTGCHKVIVECVGGGGGGGNANSTGVFTTGGGGGGGGYVKEFITSGLGTTEAVTVGVGGATDTDGEDSTFGAFCTAGKGLKGASGLTGSHGAGGTGGVGSGGTINISGKAGGGPFSNASISVIETQGGDSGLGFGLGGAPVWLAVGNNGTAYGGGGSGAKVASNIYRAGGTGADGIVIVWAYS